LLHSPEQHKLVLPLVGHVVITPRTLQVGDIVGALVGAPVGAIVGAFEGVLVVGWEVVGTPVGLSLIVGWDVVGATVGLAVDGLDVGLKVGDLVGLVVVGLATGTVGK
jgi:hypothetical protein